MTFISTNPTQTLDLQEAELPDLVNLIRKQVGLDINAVGIAKVESFSATFQTVTAQMVYQRVFYEKKADGTYVTKLEPYTVLVSCPIVTPQGGVFALTMPISAGDTALILFNDRDFSAWWASGNVNLAPDSARLHSFSDAIAIVGLRSLVNPIASYSTSEAVIRSPVARSGVTATKIVCENAVSDAKTLLQGMVDLTDSLEAALQTFSTALTGAIDPTVAGAATALNATLTSLRAALVAYKTTIAGLYK